MRAALLLCALAGAAVAQVTDRPTTTTTPVPILKQVNQVNEDGSYTYGFEAADGSFKLETRAANGEVTGKYGYVDSNGVQQVFDYNASKGAGFAPSSDLIPAPPPGTPLASTSQVAPGTFVGDIDVALDGYSEDLDEDGFVDPIPTELLQGRPQARAPAPAARPARPAVRAQAPAPTRAAQPAAAALPASTFRFNGAAPQLPALPPQQFAARQPQQFTARQPQQFTARQPQQFAAPQPQQFVPQQQFAARQPQQFVPQQFAQQARQLQQQQPAGPQRFFNVQGFDANNGVIRGFRN